jgi:hypothetical protein
MWPPELCAFGASFRVRVRKNIDLVFFCSLFYVPYLTCMLPAFIFDESCSEFEKLTIAVPSEPLVCLLRKALHNLVKQPTITQKKVGHGF